MSTSGRQMKIFHLSPSKISTGKDKDSAPFCAKDSILLQSRRHLNPPGPNISDRYSKKLIFYVYVNRFCGEVIGSGTQKEHLPTASCLKHTIYWCAVEGACSRSRIHVWLLRAAHLRAGACTSQPACNVNGVPHSQTQPCAAGWAPLRGMCHFLLRLDVGK